MDIRLHQFVMQNRYPEAKCVSSVIQPMAIPSLAKDIQKEIVHNFLNTETILKKSKTKKSSKKKPIKKTKKTTTHLTFWQRFWVTVILLYFIKI